MTQIKWRDSLFAEVKAPKNLKFTAKQLTVVRDIIDGKIDASENNRVFDKLVGLGYIEESIVENTFLRVNGNEKRQIKYQSFVYSLTDEATKILDEMTEQYKETEYQIIARKSCWKCGGKGYIREYGYVQGGVCFECNGTGKAK